MRHHVPIRLGMVGGGVGAMIGNVHRIASRLDGRFRLVAGALSSTPARAAASAAEAGIDRSYADFNDMAKAEATRADGIEAVAICTPNHLHFPVARAFLARGIHVICDKPMTATLEQARELAALVRTSDALFVLTHNYSAYPQIRQARAMVARGDLGRVRVVQVEYAQDWLTDESRSKQAEWRAIWRGQGRGAPSATSAPMPCNWRASSPECGPNASRRTCPALCPAAGWTTTRIS